MFLTGTISVIPAQMMPIFEPLVTETFMMLCLPPPPKNQNNKKKIKNPKIQKIKNLKDQNSKNQKIKISKKNKKEEAIHRYTIWI